MPMVSVVIPTYNRASYLAEAIESVLNQTFKDWELIVSIDGSKDGSLEIVRSYVERDSRVKFVWEENGGHSHALNRGIRKASGIYVAFLDDDDRWLPEKLELQVNMFQARPKIGFCYTRFRVFRKTENGLEEGKLFPQILITKFEELSDAFVPPSATMIKKSLLEEVGGFNPQYHISVDFDLWLRLWQRCEVAAIDKALAFTVMDGRVHSAQDETKVSIETAKIVENLELTHEYANRRPLKKEWIARRFYLAGRDYLDNQDYFKAAKYFTKALIVYPLVGLLMNRPEERNGFLASLKRVFTACAAPPVCVVKGLIHGRR